MSVTLTITGIVAHIGQLITKGETTRLTLTIPENTYLGPQRGRKTEWHFVTLWGAMAERAVRDLRVGSVVQVHCSISYFKTPGGGRLTNFNASSIEYIKDYGQKVQAPSKDVTDEEVPL